MYTNKLNIFFLMTLVPLTLSCSSFDFLTVKKDNTNISSNLGPKGGGTIDPKITAGQTIINLKQGDSSLVFNINLKSASFSTKATTDNVTTTAASTTTTGSNSNTDANKGSSTSSSVSKLTNELYINDEKYQFDIPADKLNDSKHAVSIIGLKKGDKVNLSTEVYDSKNELVGKEITQKKEITKEIETVDVNISIKIEIKVEQKTEVKVEQTQTGPTININITPPSQTPNMGGSTNNENCVRPGPPPERLVKLDDGTTFKLCQPNTTGADCKSPDSNSMVKLTNGKTVTICPPPANIMSQPPTPQVTISTSTP